MRGDETLSTSERERKRKSREKMCSFFSVWLFHPYQKEICSFEWITNCISVLMSTDFWDTTRTSYSRNIFNENMNIFMTFRHHSVCSHCGNFFGISMEIKCQPLNRMSGNITFAITKLWFVWFFIGLLWLLATWKLKWPNICIRYRIYINSCNCIGGKEFVTKKKDFT